MSATRCCYFKALGSEWIYQVKIDAILGIFFTGSLWQWFLCNSPQISFRLWSVLEPLYPVTTWLKQHSNYWKFIESKCKILAFLMVICPKWDPKVFLFLKIHTEEFSLNISGNLYIWMEASRIISPYFPPKWTFSGVLPSRSLIKSVSASCQIKSQWDYCSGIPHKVCVWKSSISELPDTCQICL